MNLYSYKYITIPDFSGNPEENIRSLLIQNNKTKIYEHVKSVADTNEKIAGMYKLNKKVCRMCGLLHDISAVLHPCDMLNYMKDNNLWIDEAEQKYPFLLHQRISRFISHDLFNIEDERILSAVECHTTLKSNPSQYDMALFISDKLSWDQEGLPPFYDSVYEALSESLEKSCLSYINYIINNKMILSPHTWLLQARDYLKINT